MLLKTSRLRGRRSGRRGNFSGVTGLTRVPAAAAAGSALRGRDSEMVRTSQKIEICACEEADIAAIVPIYAREVLHGLATFEETPPSLDEMTCRWRDITGAGYPYLVAKIGGRLVGYAYASTYRPRPAYRYAVENTVYVDTDSRGMGVGSALVRALIARCEEGGWRQMVAIIGDAGNTGSRALHTRLGFREVGVLQAVGFKLGRWVDSVIMQRPLGLSDRTDPDA